MKLFFMIALLLTCALTASAAEQVYTVGAGAGWYRPTAGDFFDFDSKVTFDAGASHFFARGWELGISYTAFTLANDSTADFADSIGTLANNSPLDLEIHRLGLSIRRYLVPDDALLAPFLGGGGGLYIWKGANPADGNTYEVEGSSGETTDFSATELFLSAQLGARINFSHTFSLDLLGHADLLTGAGTNLSEDLASGRDTWMTGISARLNLHLGGTKAERTWESSTQWRQTRDENPPVRSLKDSDGDGVGDNSDQCQDTPPGAVVDRQGCPVDSDRDGVFDGLDHCPGTHPTARDKVDIYGCPYDSDYDGVADYLDACPNNPAGALVDANGCPIDSDGDGVPDGLDDCPHTLPDVDVDKFGCMDLEVFAQPLVLNIDYVSGSFEVDPNTRERLRRLAGLLNFVESIRLEIVGYTDNVGSSTANQQLSEKRAQRVMGFLESLGVERSRMKALGLGETNFVASNQTAEGRARNRRVEIVFYR